MDNNKHMNTIELLESLIERIPESGCWIFTGSTDECVYKGRARGGYGKLVHEGRKRSAHRVSYEAHNGAIPDGMNVLHKCDVRCCINPHHLYIGTQKDNMRDCVTRNRHNKPNGSAHPKTHLTESQVCSLRYDRVNGMKYRELADKYNISIPAISHILMGRAWKRT